MEGTPLTWQTHWVNLVRTLYNFYSSLEIFPDSRRRLEIMRKMPGLPQNPCEWWVAWGQPMGRGCFGLSALVSTKPGWLRAKLSIAALWELGVGVGTVIRGTCAQALRPFSFQPPPLACLQRQSLLFFIELTQSQDVCYPQWAGNKGGVLCGALRYSEHQGLSPSEWRMGSCEGHARFTSHTQKQTRLPGGLLTAEGLDCLLGKVTVVLEVICHEVPWWCGPGCSTRVPSSFSQVPCRAEWTHSW